jgi:hypothetical protein
MNELIEALKGSENIYLGQFKMEATSGFIHADFRGKRILLKRSNFAGMYKTIDTEYIFSENNLVGTPKLLDKTNLTFS